MEPDKKLKELRARLVIDDNDLDTCLVEQSELLFHAAEGAAYAIAERDATKLVLDELIAELDVMLRLRAKETEEKITETALEHALARLPRIQQAQRKHLDAKKLSGLWGALKEGYVDRSKMLESLVRWKLRQMSDLSIADRGVKNAKAMLGDSTVERVKQLRRAQRDAE